MVTVRLLSSTPLASYPNSTTNPNHMFPNSSQEVAKILPDRPQFVFRGLSRTFHISLHPDTIFIPPRLDELTTMSRRGFSFLRRFCLIFPFSFSTLIFLLILQPNLCRVNPRFSNNQPSARLCLLLLRYCPTQLTDFKATNMKEIQQGNLLLLRKASKATRLLGGSLHLSWDGQFFTSLDHPFVFVYLYLCICICVFVFVVR